MTREEALRSLRAPEAALRAAGVEALWLFGSVARDEAWPESDVDLLFEAREGAFRSYFDYLDAKHVAEDVLSSRIDLADRARLLDRARPTIEREAVRVL